MILLVSGATATCRKLDSPYIGQLISPHCGNRIWSPVWAADNAAYSNWNESKFVAMLSRIRANIDNCAASMPKFVAIPDEPMDARATRRMADKWRPVIEGLQLPTALVLQDGQEWIGADWERYPAVFIGGSTEFKLGRYVRWAVGEAKARGQWVHMGRVNSVQRIQYAMEIGCDSVDGTSMSMFPATHLPRFISAMTSRQLPLFCAE